MLVGYGPTEIELKKLITELRIETKVLIRPAAAIRDVLPILDIFVLPSLWEGQPIAMLEAMAAGRPVVATKVGGIPEIIVDGENGLLAEPKDEVSLAEKISLLIGDKELRDKLSRAAKLVVENYSLPAYINKLEEHFIKEYELKSKI